MLKVGITGGMGSGKSTVCKIFSTLGIPVFDADLEAKKLYDEDAGLKKMIIEHFGAHLYPNDIFNKDEMRKIIFKDPSSIDFLNQHIHPRVKEKGQAWMNQQTSPYAIKEAALLFESGSYKDMDEVILVVASTETRLARILKRDSISKEEILSRMKRQMPDSEKLKKAQHIIQNELNDMLIPQVIQLHQLLLSKSKGLQ